MYIRLIALIAFISLIPASVQAQISAGTQMMAPQPLASYAQGQAMMTQAAQRVALLDVTFTFLDKEYKDDTYATDMFGNKYRTGCYRFKVNSGFRFKMDVPQFTLNNQGLTIVQNISTLNAEGLSARAQVVACQEFGLGVGLRLNNVRVTYTARPNISFNQSNGACTIGWNQDSDDVRVTIGSMNVLGVQNDIEKLAKNAVEDAVNLTLEGFFGSMMRSELLKVSVGVCGQPKTRTR